MIHLIRRRHTRACRQGTTAGFTIIELMVSILLMAIVSAAFLVAVNTVYKGIHKQQGVVDAADGNRRVFQLLDKQVRYATAINTPATATDGNFYIEYQWTRRLNGLDAPTCTQWRLNPVTDVVQYRTWAAGTTPSPTPAWVTAATGVTNTPSSNPPWSLVNPNQNGVTLQYQSLKLNLVAQRDNGTNNTTSTFTALNTQNSAALATSVCQEVARS